MESGNGKLLVCGGNANRKLAEDICKKLDAKPADMVVGRFSEGEIKVQIKQNVRGCDVFVIQPTCPPVNDNLMELLIIIDAVRRASARRITAVMPYYGYARQDRKDRPRVPITAKLIANIVTGAGANRVLTIDLHAGQIQGFFDIPVDNLYGINVFADYFDKKKIKDRCIVSPDVGGIKAARAYAKRLQAGLAIVDKRRRSDTEAEAMHILGEVEGKNIILVDDIVATAGSLVEAVEALKKAGAREVYGAITHAVLSGPAIERIKKSPIKELLITDTIPLENSKKMDKIKVLSVSKLLAEAIQRIHYEKSVSALFD
jgi:ribose-phosphate pyrophosphokinase